MRSTIRSRAIFALSIAGSLALAGAAAAATADLTSVKDNTLIEAPLTNSNGSGDGIWSGRIGTNGNGTVRRGLVAFDVSSIPAGATVDAVTLTLQVAHSFSPTARTVTLHRVLADWGEAGSFGAGQGGLAQPGDATWEFRFFDTDTWATPGGDFDATESASASVADQAPYTWTGAGLVADVQSWVDNPASNFGWLIKGDEVVLQAVKRFYSREGLVPPRLQVDYTASTTGVPPGSGTAAVSFAAPWPAPSSGRVNLSYTLPRAGRVSLTIHDAAGRVVRRLVNGVFEPAGPHATVWDGRSDSGADAASGVYLARLVVDGEALQHRIPMLR